VGVDGTRAELTFGGVGVSIHKSNLHSLECLPCRLLSLDIIGLIITIDNPYINFVL